MPRSKRLPSSEYVHVHTQRHERRVNAIYLGTLDRNTRNGIDESDPYTTHLKQEHEITLPKLFGPLAARYKDRKGGYTRIHKLGNRFGDNAPVAVIELIDGPGDLKNEMLFKSLARLEKNQPGSIKELVNANLAQKGTLTAGLTSVSLARHIPKVLSTNNWELSDLVAKVRDFSIHGSSTQPQVKAEASTSTS